MSYTNPFPLVPSASEMHRIAACPPSKKMAAAAKDYSDHKDADKGNEVHAILAGEEDADSSPYDAVQTAEMCEEQAQRLLNEWQDMGAESPLGFKEVRYGMTTLGNVVLVTPETRADLIVTGQFDRLYIQGNRGLLIDFKALHGKHAHALENAQLATLAVLVSRRHKLDGLRVAIVQPWKGKPTTADYDGQSILDANTWLYGVLKREKFATPDDRKAGDHCSNCNANYACETFREYNLQQLDVINPATIAGMDPEAQVAAMWARAYSLTPEHHTSLAEQYAPMMKRCAHVIISSFKARVEAGEIAGYTIEVSQGNREITDAQKAHNALLPLGVTSDDIIAACSLPLGAMQEAVRIRSGVKSKTEKRTAYNLTADQARAAMDKALTDAGCLARKAEKREVVKLTLE